MIDDLIKQLLEAGVHFGHQTKRWNPKMKKFIFGARSGIYIIGLGKTAETLNKTRDFLVEQTSKGQTVLFVGTKKQAQEVVAKEAARCKMFYVNKRWLGGLLTNFQTVKKSIQRLKTIEQMEKDGIFAKLSKKEVAQLTKERERLEKNLSGIKDIVNLPGILFVIDSKREEIAVKEARKLGIPVIGLIDTNCDPDMVDFPIPGNDDAMRSVQLIASLIADSIIEGRKQFLEGKGAIELPVKEPLVESSVSAEEIKEVEIEDRDTASGKPAVKRKTTAKKSKSKSKVKEE
jgi:small subunit ribosomal protein S2